MAFNLPELPYGFDALEPVIDTQTMQIHHGKHHGAYVSKLNDALAGTEWENKGIDEVLKNLDKLPKDKQTAVRNNGGGHYNHSLFWPLLAPKGQGGSPSGELASKIDSDLGGFDKFKESFSTAAATRFGSGWAWLCIAPDGKLHVCSTANQDNPIMKPAIGDAAGCGGQPILGLDVWEHAYYLNYQNRRPDYIAAFWDVINWQQVAKNFQAAGK